MTLKPMTDEQKELVRVAVAQRALAEFCAPIISVGWDELQPAAIRKWCRIADAAISAHIAALEAAGYGIYPKG